MLTYKDMETDEFFINPYPYYAQLRAQREPIWMPASDGNKVGIWLFSRYSDAQKIFRETEAISKDVARVREADEGTNFDHIMLNKDGKDHLRLRKLVSAHFAMKSVDGMRAVISEIVSQLLDALEEKGKFDLIVDLAEPLPMRVIARMMGLPKDDMGKVRAWSIAMGLGFDSLQSDPEVKIKYKQAMDEFFAYIDLLMDGQISVDKGSLISLLVEEHRKSRLDRKELSAMIMFLLFAGHETTVNVIGNGLWLLLTHPEQWQMLIDSPRLAPGAVEEILRYESPEQRSSFRLVTSAFDINGRKLEPGDRISAIIGSANRDEEHFTRAHSFDICRTPNEHLALGLGLHHCLGKNLARVESAILLEQLAFRFPGIQLCDATPSWQRNSFFRGLKNLPAYV